MRYVFDISYANNLKAMNHYDSINNSKKNTKPLAEKTLFLKIKILG